MPSALFVCPHCEKHAEVQVTTVTRSRPCPHCSELVVLQVACKDRKAKRRALLIAGAKCSIFAQETLPKSVPGPVYDPLPLEGEVFERMKMDPEIQAARKTFLIGLGVVIAAIIAAVVWHYMPASEEPAPVIIMHESIDKAPDGPTSARLPKNAVGLRYGSSTSDDKGKAMLNFETVGQATVKEESPVNKAVLLAASKFLEAESVDELLALIADAPSVEKSVRDHVTSHPLQRVTGATLAIDSSSNEKDGHWCVTATLADSGKKQIHVVAENGQARVDWPSYVVWSAMEWNQFMTTKPSQAKLFRVLADDSETRYEHAFADQQELRCIRLQNPTDSKSPPIYAYVDRRSTVASEIDFLLRQAQEKPLKLTVRLKYPMDPMTDNQVWLENVVTSGWVFRQTVTTAQKQ